MNWDVACTAKKCEGRHWRRNVDESERREIEVGYTVADGLDRVVSEDTGNNSPPSTTATAPLSLGGACGDAKMSQQNLNDSIPPEKPSIEERNREGRKK